MKKTVSLFLSLIIVLSACFLVSCGGLSGEFEASSGKLGNVTKLSFDGDEVKMTCAEGAEVTATFETEPAFITFTFASEEDAKTAGISSGKQCLFTEGEDYVKVDMITFKKK